MYMFLIQKCYNCMTVAYISLTIHNHLAFKKKSQDSRFLKETMYRGAEKFFLLSLSHVSHHAAFLKFKC